MKIIIIWPKKSIIGLTKHKQSLNFKWNSESGAGGGGWYADDLNQGEKPHWTRIVGCLLIPPMPVLKQSHLLVHKEVDAQECGSHAQKSEGARLKRCPNPPIGDKEGGSLINPLKNKKDRPITQEGLSSHDSGNYNSNRLMREFVFTKWVTQSWSLQLKGSPCW